MFRPYDWYKRSLENKYLRWVIILLTLVYLFSPIDLLPEALINVFGVIDDGVLLSLLIATLVSISHEQRRKRKRTRMEQTKQGENQTVDVDLRK